MLPARASARNKGAPLALLPACCHRRISTFRERQHVSPPDFTLSPVLSSLIRRCVVFTFPSQPSLFYSRFSPLPLLTAPVYRSFSRLRSTFIRRTACSVCTRTRSYPLVPRVTNPRFFRPFFRTKISTFRGEMRAHARVPRATRRQRKRDAIKNLVGRLVQEQNRARE